MIRRSFGSEPADEHASAHVRVTGENDGAFKASALAQLEILGEMAESKMLFEEAVSKVIAVVSDIRIKASTPRPELPVTIRVSLGISSDKTSASW